ncbi:ABC transporter substrate-binding protein [Chitinophaga rhizophila]|uniref:ABC transporter substrate-binding protein n=1 Tax=Chitinophaga rhizophila TaxID=2866212 RepID=A0ABS7GEX5_9BACT|nr:ABC transporter substrate-binding protein [Chitinophaga rhizophila]MBW8685364.1 ABC transporter substrate-binding protein [Chitinophaga rhizophila]
MSKSKICSMMVTACALTMLLSACSLFKGSTSSPTAPPTTVTKPKEEEKKKEEKKKEEKSAPFNVAAFGREVKKDVYNIALFAPLYLDSVFTNGTEIPGRTLPRYVLSGLDFYEGAQLALDSLQQQGVKLNVFVYDSKSRAHSIESLTKNKAFDNTDLIIAAVSSPEIQELSNIAKDKQINLVSATYPNDGGVTENPFLLITNSMLRTHGEVLHRYLQETFANKNILLFHRNGSFEKRIAADFKADYDKMQNNKKSRIREVIWSDAMTDGELSQYLLTDRPNLCVVTALDETNAKAILRKLSTQSANYPIQIYGMPTWDIMKFKEPEFKDLQIYYTSPYFNDKTDAYSRYITDYFKRIYKSRPSDMAFKGFELTWYFVKQLTDNGVYFNGSINDPSKKVFNNLNYQPVYLKEGNNIPDYFENKNINIIQKNDSADVRMNFQ